jgi:phage-related protein
MRLERIRSGRWTVLAVCTERGDCPLAGFLSALSGDLARDGRRLLALLERVAVDGPPRNVEVSHQLAEGIWQFAQGRLRALWFYDEGRLVIVTHGFVKRSRKAPAAEIERAVVCRQAYFRDRWRRDLRIGGAGS